MNSLHPCKLLSMKKVEKTSNVPHSVITILYMVKENVIIIIEIEY